jgi:effector-binding domain-containing protein
MTEPEITLVDAVSRQTAVVHGTLRPQDLPAFLGPAFETVAAAVARQGAHVTGPPFTAYRRLTGEEFEVEAGVPVATRIAPEGGVVPGELPSGPTAETVHTGPYENLAGTYDRLHRWLRVRGLRPAPLMWECYLTDPGDPAHRHPDGPQTLVVQPVEAELPAGTAPVAP